MRYHINKKGNPAVCRASVQACPLGGETSHFESKQEAQEFVDRQNAEKYSVIADTNELSSSVIPSKHLDAMTYHEIKGLTERLKSEFDKKEIEFKTYLATSNYDEMSVREKVITKVNDFKRKVIEGLAELGREPSDTMAHDYATSIKSSLSVAKGHNDDDSEDLADFAVLSENLVKAHSRFVKQQKKQNFNESKKRIKEYYEIKGGSMNSHREFLNTDGDGAGSTRFDRFLIKKANTQEYNKTNIAKADDAVKNNETGEFSGVSTGYYIQDFRSLDKDQHQRWAYNLKSKTKALKLTDREYREVESHEFQVERTIKSFDDGTTLFVRSATSRDDSIDQYYRGSKEQIDKIRTMLEGK